MPRASTRTARRAVLLERSGWNVVTLDPARALLIFRRRGEQCTVEVPLAEIRLHALSLKGRVRNPRVKS